jgi:hypothetical protein
MRISTYMMMGVALLAMAMLYPNWANAGSTTGVNPQAVSFAVDNSDGTVPASLVHWRGWRGGFRSAWSYPSGSYYYRPHHYRSYGYYPYSYYNYYPYGSSYYTYYPSGSYWQIY